MLKIKIIAVGKIKEKFYTDACNEYIKRLSAFCNISVAEIQEYKCPDNPSDAEIMTVIKKEGERINAAIPDGAYVIPLCIEGKEVSSPQLAQKLDRISVEGCSTVCFIIGGSFGLDDSIKSKSDFKLSMSPMTFPHMLARVMILEQIYRAFSINKGTKYHK